MKTVRWAAPAHPRLFLHWRYASHAAGFKCATDTVQGINGLTARDVKLVIDGGYNTVEAIAYT